MRWTPLYVVCASVLLVCTCSGPQPLAGAIDPADEQAYAEALLAHKGIPRDAFTAWVARERGRTAAQLAEADAALSTTRNPFDANTDRVAVSRGAIIYRAHCARCHGENVDGRGPHALPDHPSKDFHAFSKRFAVTLHKGAPKTWFKKINDGFGDVVEYPWGRGPAMPPFGDTLAREQIWLAITYLQSLVVYAAPRDESGRDGSENRR